MKKIRSRYLVKCEIPGCGNIALNMFTTNKLDTLGIPICEKCVKEIGNKYKKSESKNEKEISE